MMISKEESELVEAYHSLIDTCLQSVNLARSTFMQKDDSDDRDWCIDKFDSILDSLDIVREFL